MTEIPNIVYGKMLESAHISGYSFERLCSELIWLLEDDERWKKVGPGFNDINDFLRSMDLSPFNISDRKGLHNRIKELQPKASTRAIADLTGVNQSTVVRDIAIDANASPEDDITLVDDAHDDANASDPFNQSGVDAAKAAVNKTTREKKEEEEKLAREAKRVEAANDIQNVDSRILVGDFREKASQIPNGSISLIFTDPPYDRKSTNLFDDLGRLAADKLCEGGSLLCYIGHIQLQEALEVLPHYLRYWWICACVHSGQKALMREYGIRVGWKPMLWFVKEKRHDKKDVVLDTVSGGKQKSHHEWQQAEDEARYWIEKLCPQDGIVCDPFLGGGTTAVAAKALGRKWIGIEIDESAAMSATSRLG